MKKSFAMIMAIGFIIVLGTVGGAMMYMSSNTTKQVGDNYQLVQAKLFAKSANQFAIQSLQGHDYTKGCVNKINLDTSLFDINMTFHYFFTTCPSDCNCSNIETNESNGTIMINTYIKSKSDNIRFFEQTIQKP